MNKAKLIEDINKLKNPRILVVGDFGIDEMVFGSTQRISREAPVLILEHSNTKIILGTASNAANNISTLNGGKVSALGVYGDDYHAGILLQALEDANISAQYMVQDKERKTTTKTRISGSCSHSITQQIVRIDRQSSAPLSKQTEDKVIKNLEKAIPLHDGVILSDYHLGLLTDRVVKEAVKIAKKHSKPIVADVQKNFEKYKGTDAITPNQPDTEDFCNCKLDSPQALEKAAGQIIEEIDIKYLLLTRGSSGMVLFEKEKDKIARTDIPAFNKKEVFDVTGAGDTVVAAFTLALCAGIEPKNAAIIGNLAASIVIRHFGCNTTTREDLILELENLREEVCVL